MRSQRQGPGQAFRLPSNCALLRGPLQPRPLLMAEPIPKDKMDGWLLLKAMPWSRRKRRALFLNDQWHVHSFAGPEGKGSSTSTASRMKGAEVSGVIVNVDPGLQQPRPHEDLRRVQAFAVGRSSWKDEDVGGRTSKEILLGRVSRQPARS